MEECSLWNSLYMYIRGYVTRIIVSGIFFWNLYAQEMRCVELGSVAVFSLVGFIDQSKHLTYSHRSRCEVFWNSCTQTAELV